MGPSFRRRPWPFGDRRSRGPSTSATLSLDIFYLQHYHHEINVLKGEIACLRGCKIKLFTFVWLFSAVFFYMFPQMAFSNRFKVTQIALIWFFSAVYFQISLQTTCLRICILTLVAFVCLFSTVRLEMHAQMACLRGCMVKLLAFVRFFSTVCFQMSPQMANSRGCIVTLVAFICFVSTLWALCFCILDVSWHAQSHWLHLFGFLHCRFSNVSTKCLYKRMYSYIGCIFCPFFHCVFSNVSSNCLPEGMRSLTGCIC